jgi:cytochrome c
VTENFFGSCNLILGCTAAFFFIGTPLFAQEFEPLRPRVPVEERAMARKMNPPFGSTKRASPSIIAAGQSLYEGKGTCVSCHGESGLGDGEVGRSLNPSPRNFTNCRFHARRRDGELFWILKNGSPGTGMVPMIPVTITEEEAWKILAYERSFCRDWQR